MTAAVVELNDFHDEILPSLVDGLNALGIVPDVYLPASAAGRGTFATTPTLRYSIRVIDGRTAPQRLATLIRGTPARYRRYDVVVMNSIEPRAALEAADRVRAPLLAIVHNADVVARDPDYRRFFDRRDRRPMALARHVAAALEPGHAAAWFAPYTFGTVEPERAVGDDRQRLCVQGNVAGWRRDYGALLDALTVLAGERSDFAVDIIGRSSTPDGRKLHSAIAARGLSPVVTFSPGEIGHAEYRALASRARFLLPLVHASVAELAPYHRTKATSSMPLAIGLGIVPIVEASFARLYDAERGSVLYEDGGLLEGIRRALALGDADHGARVGELESLRSAAIDASVENLRAALRALGVPI